MNKYADPVYAAKRLRRELGIDVSDAIDIECVLSKRNIRMREDPLPEGTLGACKVKGLHRLIVVSTAIKYDSQKRFTICHEIGHVELHHGTSNCNDEDLIGFRTTSDRENDANQFASIFLLPQAAVLEALKLNDISFDMADKLAEQYGISLTATLIRLVKASPDNVCLFVHAGGKILYPVRSQGCKFRPKSGGIDPDALANRLTDSKAYINGGSDGSYWFNDDLPFDDYVCTEESRYFRHLKKAITIVNINSN